MHAAERGDQGIASLQGKATLCHPTRSATLRAGQSCGVSSRSLPSFADKGWRLMYAQMIERTNAGWARVLQYSASAMTPAVLLPAVFAFEIESDTTREAVESTSDLKFYT
jgi:hypothetical protein